MSSDYEYDFEDEYSNGSEYESDYDIGFPLRLGFLDSVLGAPCDPRKILQLAELFNDGIERGLVNVTSAVPSVHKYEENRAVDSITGSSWHINHYPTAPAMLLDIAAQVVGCNFSCQTLTMQDPPLDEALLKKVAFWAFPWNLSKLSSQVRVAHKERAWLYGEKMKDKVSMKQVGFMATAMIPVGSESSAESCSTRVSLSFEKQTLLRSSCSVCTEDVWCSHIIAAICHRIHNVDKVVVHAPVTEVLSTLDRNQLQKLIQYTINDDPKSTLSKVFKYIDELRDVNSEINQLDGAPDPSILSLPEGSMDQWQKTLEGMELSLDKVIKQSHLNRAKIYPQCYDVTLKAQSILQTYLRQVKSLVSQKLYHEAADVLRVLYRCVMAKSLDLDGGCCSYLRMFLHDLDRFYAAFIIVIVDKDKEVYAQLDKDVDDAQRFYSGMHPSMKRLEHSLVAELPAIYNVIPVKMQDADGEDHHFPQAKSAFRVAAAPQSFTDLINGDISPEDSDYTEPMELMLLRLEAVLLFEENKNHDKFSRLAERILRQLTYRLVKLSVLMKHVPSLAHSSVSECWRILSASSSPTTQTAASTSTASGSMSSTIGKSNKRRSSCKVKHAVKRLKTSAASDSPVPALATSSTDQAPLTYALTYILRILLDITREQPDRISLCKHWLTNCSMLALEMLHFILNSSYSISPLEGAWLKKLQPLISEPLISLYAIGETATPASFLEAVYHQGDRAYGKQYPLLLVQNICALGACGVSVLQESAMMVHICFKTLIGILDWQETVPLSMYYLYIGQLEKHLKIMVKSFIKHLNTEMPDQVKAAVQVFESLQLAKNRQFLEDFNEVIRDYIPKMEMQPDLLAAIFSLCLNNISSKVNFYHFLGAKYNHDILVRVAPRIGLKCLDSIEDNWTEKMSFKQMSALLRCLEPEFKDKQDLPPQVFRIVKNYFKARTLHPEHETKIFLEYLLTRHDQLDDVADIIVDSDPYFYYINNLLQIVVHQMDTVTVVANDGTKQEKKRGKKRKAKSDGDEASQKKEASRSEANSGKHQDDKVEEKIVYVMNDKALRTLLKTFTMKKPLSASCVFSEDDMKKIAQGCVNVRNVKTLDSYIKQMVACLKVSNMQYPELYPVLIEAVNAGSQFRTPPGHAATLKATKELFVHQLLESQRLYVTNHLQKSSSSASTYRNIIRLLNSYRMTCLKLFSNGEKRFAEAVIPKLLTEFKNKKKFCSMLRKEFP